MKEILFRGKRVDNGEFIVGDLVQNNGKAYIVNKDVGDCICLGVSEWVQICEISLTSIGQFTGRLDKNGKQIFEGDILKGEQYPFKDENGCHNYFAEVCWWDNSPAFGIYTFKNPQSTVRGISTGNTDSMEDWCSNDWEVIGNIYDNPELMEG